MGMKKNQEYEIVIEDMGNEGEGIGHIDGVAVFVKDTVVGDVARIRIVKVKKQYAYGRLTDMIEPSTFRVKPICSLARKCGGCSIMQMDYHKQLDWKRDKVVNCLKRIGGIADVEQKMEPIIGIERKGEGNFPAIRYRNKAQFPVQKGKDGKPLIGFYAGRTHSVMDTEVCYLQDRVNDELIQRVRAFIEAYQVEPYDEETHTGLVRHILTRVGRRTGEVMVCLILNGEELTGRADGQYVNELVGLVEKNEGDMSTDLLVKKEGEGRNGTADRKSINRSGGSVTERPGNRSVGIESRKRMNGRLRTNSFSQKNKGQKKQKRTNRYRNVEQEFAKYMQNISGMTSISINVNKERTNRILGDNCRTIWGRDTITDYIGNVKYQISPLSFYQVNPEQTEKLYKKALEYADLHGDEMVWDLYCGIGTISLFLAQQARQVRGVEIIPAAIEDARKNAQMNGITNVEFFVGRAEEVLPEQFAKTGERADVIVVDPPRKGCDPEAIRTMIRMAPDRIVYVSCDPATLARDVKLLEEAGYEVSRVCPVDMFGHCSHVECVVLLSRENE